MLKKLKGDPLGFFNIHSVAKRQKSKEGSFGKFFLSLTMPKKLKGDPLDSPSIVCYAEKKNKFYISVPCAKWSNFAPYSCVELCKTILVSSGALQKSVTIIVAFQAPTKKFGS